MPISTRRSPISAAAEPTSGCGRRSMPRRARPSRDERRRQPASRGELCREGMAVRRHCRSDQAGFPYIALNPGASYRGLHDSLVNYGGNKPPLLLCQHEKIAVQIAHGYAKATGKPMVAIVHDVVGMLHATMGIYYAYLDRCPVFVIGATGPIDESRRRPFIDWIHTANVNGEQLRHYVKWD